MESTDAPVTPPPAPDAPKKRGRVENLTNAGKGRPKGSKNKVPKLVKQMIADALNEVGDEKFFIKLARSRNYVERVAFANLAGKLIPTQVTGEDGGPLQVVIQKIANDADTQG